MSPAFGAPSPPGASGPSAPAGDAVMVQLLSVVRRDKEMLAKKLELAQLEVRMTERGVWGFHSYGTKGQGFKGVSWLWGMNAAGQGDARQEAGTRTTRSEHNSGRGGEDGCFYGSRDSA